MAAKTLEEYMSEVSQGYNSSRDAINQQIAGVDSSLQSTLQNINRQYDVQKNTLDQDRQNAATNASIQAAGSGGAFGGSANLVNRERYKNYYVPALTQLQTNQSNDLASARSSAEQQRRDLNSQLANLEAQVSNAALERYYAALEQDRQEQLERDKMAQDQSQFETTNKYNYDSLAQNQRQFETTNKYNYDSLAQNQKQFEATQTYNYAALAQAQSQFEAQQAESKRQFNEELKYKYDTNQITREQMAQAQRQFEATQAWEKQKFAESQAQAQKQFDADLAYKYASLNKSSSGGGSSGGSVNYGLLGAGAGSGSPQSQSNYYINQNGADWQFKDGNGNGVTFARYIDATGENAASLLNRMAASGDANAKYAVSLLNSDYSLQSGNGGGGGLGALGLVAVRSNGSW